MTEKVETGTTQAPAARQLRFPLADPLFYSLQGEGATLGRPSVFVRLMGCTVGCAWCDTKYSWAGPPAAELTGEEILRYCRERPGCQAVITGGEPLESPFFEPLLLLLHEAGLRVEVETSGYLEPSLVALAYVDQWNVSPKLASAGISPEKKPRSLGWLDRANEPYLKFVLHHPREIAEVDQMLQALGLAGWPPERVIVSPGGKKYADMEKRLLPLAEAALARGFRFTPRLHVILWGDKRGV
ncbi:MAG: 7-carboxy-7-deazaguanine synthase QueE [Candidatus Tectomicrobia bacterium]|uniref:7-carboxy-7-deazaguanine synthase n=1 Tax=Tectimicrobiota bacterium TaxID=2528274 RepID=A0A932I0Z5_UNCTE|nr:7-carboxy-7-deazaguanine synthase QueE [Candidatus Tectomicrobia bacterium]